MDVFSWSVPFLAEKVTNMLFSILKKGGEGDEGEVDINQLLAEAMDPKIKRQIAMKGKINSVARMSRMYTTLREQSEMLL